MVSNVGAAPEATPGLRTPANARTLTHPLRHRLVIPTPSGHVARARPATRVHSEPTRTRSPTRLQRDPSGRCSFRLDAVVSADVYETPAGDDTQSSAAAPSSRPGSVKQGAASRRLPGRRAPPARGRWDRAATGCLLLGAELEDRVPLGDGGRVGSIRVGSTWVGSTRI